MRASAARSSRSPCPTAQLAARRPLSSAASASASAREGLQCTAMRAPASCRLRAIAAPMRRAAPVMRTASPCMLYFRPQPEQNRSVAQGSTMPEPTLPPPAPEAAAHSRRLAEAIAETIADEGDWVPFSRYMELALYMPGLGYYAAGAQKFGEAGDYVTSPEVSPMFAKCLGLQAAQVLKEVGGDILELGPGSGLLAADLLDSLKETGKLPDRYLLLEVSPDLRERQRSLLASRHPADLARFVWLDALPEQFRGMVIANEVLDVVPCSLVNRTRGEIGERGVIVTEAGFAWDDQALPDGEPSRRAAAAFPPRHYASL